jgi:hypothetical protein
MQDNIGLAEPLFGQNRIERLGREIGQDKGLAAVAGRERHEKGLP